MLSWLSICDRELRGGSLSYTVAGGVGGDKIAVDCVLIIGEHGKYELDAYEMTRSVPCGIVPQSQYAGRCQC